MINFQKLVDTDHDAKLRDCSRIRRGIHYIVISCKISEFQSMSNEVIPDHENHKRGGHCLSDIYLSVSELKVKIFMNYLISVPNETKS